MDVRLGHSEQVSEARRRMSYTENLVRVDRWYCPKCGKKWDGEPKAPHTEESCQECIDTTDTHQFKSKWGRRIGMDENCSSVYNIDWTCSRCGLEQSRPEGIRPACFLKCNEAAMHRVLD